MTIYESKFTGPQIDAGIFSVMTRDLTSQDILSLSGTPITLIPGISGKLIVPIYLAFEFSAIIPHYLNGGDLRISYTTSPSPIYSVLLFNTISANRMRISSFFSFQSAKYIETEPENGGPRDRGIGLWCGLTPFTNGVGTAKITILYNII